MDTTIRCKGVTAATCYGSQQFKLFLQDQDFLEEFLEKKWEKNILYLVGFGGLWTIVRAMGRLVFFIGVAIRISLLGFRIQLF
ncbi:MAG: hypothetical protein V2I56_24855 [Desulfobacteraceae bacterium]|jgi:hypothetical protein|nr:hypothetical protein [Desulfobacteraceae bacterium]